MRKALVLKYLAVKIFSMVPKSTEEQWKANRVN